MSRSASSSAKSKAVEPDAAVAPEHVFYYGFLFGNGVQAPCSPQGGEDSELYRSSGEARPAEGAYLGERVRAGAVDVAELGERHRPAEELARLGQGARGDTDPSHRDAGHERDNHDFQMGRAVR